MFLYLLILKPQVGFLPLKEREREMGNIYGVRVLGFGKGFQYQAVLIVNRTFEFNANFTITKILLIFPTVYCFC